jgi:zinc protease
MSPQVRSVPGLTKPRRPKLPAVAERTMANGLRVAAVRRAGVPMVHLRLRVPFA